MEGDRTDDVGGEVLDSPTFESAVLAVVGLLGSAIWPTIFSLADGSIIARLTVDPDIAMAALAKQVNRA